MCSLFDTMGLKRLILFLILQKVLLINSWFFYKNYRFLKLGFGNPVHNISSRLSWLGTYHDNDTTRDNIHFRWYRISSKVKFHQIIFRGRSFPISFSPNEIMIGSIIDIVSSYLTHYNASSLPTKIHRKAYNLKND